MSTLREALVDSEPVDSDSLRALEALYIAGKVVSAPADVSPERLWYTLGSARGILGADERFLADMMEFVRRGGMIACAPESTKPGEWAFHLRSQDFVLPACHEGMNRSQVLYLVLQGLRRVCATNEPVRVAVPHGAESGYDPHAAYDAATLTEDNMYAYIHGHMLPRGSPGDWLHENFHRVFGVDKQRRPGQVTAAALGVELNPDDYAPDLAKLAAHRQAQRAAMKHLYYDPDELRKYTGEGGRIVYIGFARAPGILVHRLLEATSKSMEGVVMVLLPFPDTISRAGGRADIEAHNKAWGREDVTRDELSCRRHEEVYAYYASLFFMTP